MEQDERLAALKAEFARQQQNDKKAASLLEKIETGHAAFSDATQYSFRLGALLGRAFKAVLASEDDKACLLDPDVADALVRPLLAQSASLASNAAEQAIRTQNQAVGIGLNAQTADPQRISDRIDGIVTSVSMQPDADSALDALERESVGFSASAADEALEASGNFLASVGRSAKIVRTASANACAWCLEREGTYEYPDVPKDVFQRHANCTCTLDYYPAERSARQNAWTKKWAEQVGREVRESTTLENQTTLPEQSRPVNIGTPQVDLTYINSPSYRSKFNSISDNPALNQAIYKYAKAAVIHQSGDYYEDLSILTTEGDLVKQTSGKIPNQTNTTGILPYINQYPPYTLLSIHNHGTNLPPSGADFASAGEKKYAFGIVACNNGKLYYYSTAKARPFLSKLFDDTVDKYCSPPYNMSTSNAYSKALKELEKYGVEWRELE